MKVRLYVERDGKTTVEEFPVSYIAKLTPEGKRMFEQKLKAKFAQRNIRLKKVVFI